MIPIVPYSSCRHQTRINSIQLWHIGIVTSNTMINCMVGGISLRISLKKVDIKSLYFFIHLC